MMNTYLPKHTIQKPSKGWKYKFDELSHEELLDNFDKKFKIKKKGIREKLRELGRRRNLKEKENYDSEEDKEEARKLADQIKISEEFWEKYNNQQKLNPFFDSDDDVYMSSGFGKRQKKDIKGMIKKILLYGGLPTLLVVSLGVLSNKKINTGKVKKNIKVKANVQEKIFKKAFVSKLKEYYKTKRGEIKKMDKEEQKNLADTQKRKENRNKKSTNPFDELIKPSKLEIKKPSNPFDELIKSSRLEIKKPPESKKSSNPQQGVKSPPRNEKPATIQEIVAKGLLAQNLQNEKIPKNPVKKKNQRKKKPKRKFTIRPMGQV